MPYSSTGSRIKERGDDQNDTHVNDSDSYGVVGIFALSFSGGPKLEKATFAGGAGPSNSGRDEFLAQARREK
jgi:hypothetical protein